MYFLFKTTHIKTQQNLLFNYTQHLASRYVTMAFTKAKKVDRHYL